MSNQYIGEVRMFGGNFAPVGWLFCDGQLLQISQYDALFNLIGTTYGGDGMTTFALPDLRGRIPIHMGTNAGVSHVLGEAAGTETVTLTPQQMPAHTHGVNCNSSGSNDSRPNGNVWGAGRLAYSDYGAPLAPMNTASVGQTGGSQPHENMPPYLAVNFIIATEGIYPSQT